MDKYKIIAISREDPNFFLGEILIGSIGVIVSWYWKAERGFIGCCLKVESNEYNFHKVKLLKQSRCAMKETDQVYTMTKDMFAGEDDGNGGKILLADCPNCKDAVVYGDGCVNCDADFIFN